MIASLLAAAALAQTSAVAAPPGLAGQCFHERDYQNFRAISARAFYVRVGAGEIFRIDTAQPCPDLLEPDARLVIVVRGGDQLCLPEDWELRVGTRGPNGFARQCVVRSQRRLSPAEAAAIPRDLRP